MLPEQLFHSLRLMISGIVIWEFTRVIREEKSMILQIYRVSDLVFWHIMWLNLDLSK